MFVWRSISNFKILDHSHYKSRDISLCIQVLATTDSTVLLMTQELVEQLNKKELSSSDYPCMNEPTSPSLRRSSESLPSPSQSRRSRRRPTWARPRNSDDGYSR